MIDFFSDIGIIYLFENLLSQLEKGSRGGFRNEFSRGPDFKEVL